MKPCPYSMVIQWSDEDQVYVVTFPEFGGCRTHGETYKKAAKAGEEVLELVALVHVHLRRHEHQHHQHIVQIPTPPSFLEPVFLRTQAPSARNQSAAGWPRFLKVSQFTLRTSKH